MILQQVSERQNRGLIRDSITNHIDPCETAHRRHLDQHILHGWIAEVIPLLQKMDLQHGCQRIGRLPTLGAGLGIVGLDQINQRFPGHHLLNLGQKSLTPGALLGCGFLVTTESKLLAAHDPSAPLRLHGYFCTFDLGFHSLLSRSA